MNEEDFKENVIDHLKGFPIRQRELQEMREVIFGNKQTGEKGMKEKLDTIYEILVQARGVGNFFGGIKGILGLLIVMGAAVTIIKGWLMK